MEIAALPTAPKMVHIISEAVCILATTGLPFVSGTTVSVVDS